MKLLVTGASGKLGGYVVSRAAAQGWQVVPLTNSWCEDLLGHPVESLDLRDEAALANCLESHRPDAVLHLAALSDVNECFQHPGLAEQINRLATADLARRCQLHGAYLLSVSTDMVFDGEAAPYAEDSPPTPTSVYGRSKVMGEQEVLAHADFAVVRVALMAGPTLTRRRSFFDHLVTQLQEGKSLRLFADEWRAVLSLRVAADTLLQLCKARPKGIFHLAGERMSRYDMGLLTADALGLPNSLLEPGSRSEFQGNEPRQKDLTLRCERVQSVLPGWTAGDLAQEIREMMPA